MKRAGCLQPLPRTPSILALRWFRVPLFFEKRFSFRCGKTSKDICECSFEAVTVLTLPVRCVKSRTREMGLCLSDNGSARGPSARTGQHHPS